MISLIEKALHSLGDNSEITKCQPVSGGDINEAYRVQTLRKTYFVKHNSHIPEGFFESEANGLNEIRNTHTASVPDVLALEHEGRHGVLVLEWIQSGPKLKKTDMLLGQDAAQMHQTAGKQYGYGSDSFIGRLPQPNGWHDDWEEYYRMKRLYPQIRLAGEKGRLSNGRGDKLEKLLSSLHRWIPSNPIPSLLHGDLWGGNWIAGPNGKPYLIDPSVFYGDHEMEIAFTELFGGFNADFYSAYNEIMPLSPEYEERKQLYQLYFLLVHLNLFGETYGSAVDQAVKRYI
ncbi:fructosamine kinase family protein [Metabacillus sp. GX 13764]|uniref:fructosamine kinase family protein n=1 Tax=Metabacillus kandeliae TaxID=2900151 RepID=UPI001E31119A|nr:fructosamine kinase family protein [Metabacillus kandeliae]MCD7034752.1 fructosamine kinase family protein [Metabacillus kandeliae]